MKRFVLTLICILLCLGISACGGAKDKKDSYVASSPEKAGEMYEKTYYTLNYKAHDSLLLVGGEDFYRYLAVKESKDDEEIYKELSSGEASNYKAYCKYMNEKSKKSMENRYGDFESFKIKSSKASKLESGEFDEIKELFKKTYSDYIDADKITEGYKVYVSFTIKGSDKEETESRILTVVKYNGDYKIFEGLGG